MFKVKIIAVGKIKEPYIEEGLRDYVQRIKPYAHIDIKEVKDEGGASKRIPKAERDRILAKEASGIRRHVSAGEHIIALDRKGKRLSSPQLAAYLSRLGSQGQSRVGFVIGGSVGLDPAILEAADTCLSFSTYTFPHQLFRLLLLEQVYRAFTILNGHPYHK